ACLLTVRRWTFPSFTLLQGRRATSLAPGSARCGESYAFEGLLIRRSVEVGTWVPLWPC
ncbi:unnamed protein product, partial [Polarella glacialis]